MCFCSFFLGLRSCLYSVCTERAASAKVAKAWCLDSTSSADSRRRTSNDAATGASRSSVTATIDIFGAHKLFSRVTFFYKLKEKKRKKRMAAKASWGFTLGKCATGVFIGGTVISLTAMMATPDRLFSAKSALTLDEQRSALGVMGFAGTILLSYGLAIVGGLDPNVRAAELAAKESQKHAKAIYKHAHELFMACTNPSTADLVRFLDWGTVPQSFIDLATTQLENISP